MGLLACLFSIVAALPSDGPPPPTNLLVLYVDDLNVDLRLPGVQTPHIDALEARGVRFDRAYAAHPLCTPSRIALLAGQYTHHTEAVANDYAGPPFEVNRVAYLPRLLRQSGYWSARAGKVFHFPQAGCFDVEIDEPDDPWIVKPLLPHIPNSGGTIYGGPFLNGPDGSLGKMQDTKNADAAIAMLGTAAAQLAATGQPFALWFGLQATHDPFIYPEAYGALYDTSMVPPLPVGEQTLPWKSAVNKASWSTHWFYDPAWGATVAERRAQALLAYFRCISFIDAEIGRVLGRLEALGLAESTVVVLVSDHGWSFSEHAHIGKLKGFDEDIVAPLIIAAPALPSSCGQLVATPVSQVDLYPTITELLGVRAPAGLDGTSLVPLMLDASVPHPPAFYTSHHESGFNLVRHVVQRDAGTGEVWKLAAWEADDSIPQVHQLYNLSADPGEYVNLHLAPSAQAKVAELRGALLAVGLLGPLARNFGIGTAGALGVPALTWSGPPVPGAEGLLMLGNAAGAPTIALLNAGLSGYDWGSSPSLFVVPQWSFVVPLPQDGLSVEVLLPEGAAFHELPLGVQLLHHDLAAPKQIAMSRGLSLFLSY